MYSICFPPILCISFPVRKREVSIRCLAPRPACLDAGWRQRNCARQHKLETGEGRQCCSRRLHSFLEFFKCRFRAQSFSLPLTMLRTTPTVSFSGGNAVILDSGMPMHNVLTPASCATACNAMILSAIPAASESSGLRSLVPSMMITSLQPQPGLISVAIPFDAWRYWNCALKRVCWIVTTGQGKSIHPSRGAVFFSKQNQICKAALVC